MSGSHQQAEVQNKNGSDIQMLGNTPWPPHGDINSPNERGRVSQFAGKRYVAAGSRSEPGVCGFIRPSIMTSATTV